LENQSGNNHKPKEVDVSSELIEFISTFPGIKGLFRRKLNILADEVLKEMTDKGIGRIFEYPTDHVIIRKGDEFNGYIWWIIDGQIVIKAFPQEITTRISGAGELFGEASFVDKKPRSADVIMEKTTRCFRLDTMKLKNLDKEEVKLACREEILMVCAGALADKLREENERTSIAETSLHELSRKHTRLKTRYQLLEDLCEYLKQQLTDISEEA